MLQDIHTSILDLNLQVEKFPKNGLKRKTTKFNYNEKCVT